MFLAGPGLLSFILSGFWVGDTVIKIKSKIKIKSPPSSDFGAARQDVTTNAAVSKAAVASMAA